MGCLRLIVHGLVQGVGYRNFARREGMALQIMGRVWNRRDGKVELLVSGEKAAMEKFIERLRQGPPSAQVDKIEILPSEEKINSQSLDITETI